jgi:hypothetical protein
MRAEWGDLTVANTLMLGYVIKVSLCFLLRFYLCGNWLYVARLILSQAATIALGSCKCLMNDDRPGNAGLAKNHESVTVLALTRY